LLYIILLVDLHYFLVNHICKNSLFMKKNQFLTAFCLFCIWVLPSSLYAQLTPCGSTTLSNVSRLVNVKIAGNALLLAEAAPASVPSGRVIRHDLSTNTSNTLINSLDFPLGMDIHPINGNLYVGERGFANANNNRIRVFNQISNTQITTIPRLNTNEIMDVFSIDAMNRLFVLVNNMSGNTLINTSIRAYNTKNGHQVINLTGIPLVSKAGERFLDLDTYTDYYGITHLAVTNFTTGNVHIFSIDANNNVFAQRSFSAQAPAGMQVSRIVIDDNKFIHLNYGAGSGASSQVRSFCFAGVQVAAQTLYPATTNGWLNGIDIRNGTIYTPYCNAQANRQNDPVYCLNFTPPTATAAAVVSINGSVSTTAGTPIVIPITITGQQPSATNPYTVRIVRQSPAQVTQFNLTTPPYQYVDNYANTAGTYTYQIEKVTALLPSCDSVRGEGTFTAQIADSTATCGDLWGKDFQADNGDTENCINQTTPAWASPDIWLSPSADAFNDDTDRKPEVGEVNYVYVRVRNRGEGTDKGKLRLYWAAASTGLFWKQSWTGQDVCQVTGTPLGGEIVGNVVDETGATITNGMISVNAAGEKVYRFEWSVPNPNDYAACFFNGGQIDAHHFCLLVRIEQEANEDCKRGALPENETISTYGNTVCNNNIYWQNVTILDEVGEDGSLTAGVITRGSCLPLEFWTVGNGAISDTPDELQCCTKAQYKFTWKNASETDFWNYGNLLIQLPAHVYNAWVQAGSQGSGVVEVAPNTLKVVAPNGFIYLSLGLEGTVGITHKFIPKGTSKKELSIDLVQEACTPTLGCKIVGGERFVLRNFSNGRVEQKATPQTSENKEGAKQETPQSMTLYPNPVNQSLNLDMKTVGTYQVTVYDVMGTILLKQEVKNAQNATLNVSQLPTGVYLLHTVSADGKIAISRFVKQ
jgi:hypothetical protein